MTFELGSAIKIISIPDPVDNTTMTVEQIIDPDGAVLVANASMSLETVNSVSRFYYVWQSETTNTAGRYTYITKAVQGLYSDRKKAHFYLEDE